MGHYVSALISGLGRFFEYPVKRKPICFYRQEDFTATGEPQRKVSEVHKGMMTDYDILVDQFYKRLAEQRQYNQEVQFCKICSKSSPITENYKDSKNHERITTNKQKYNKNILELGHNYVIDCNEMKEQDRRSSMQKVVRRFPGWNEVTIANLHSLFLLFDNQSNGMLGFDDLCAVLESLGDETSMETRKQKFNEADTDTDGWITYDEFLALLYNFSPQIDGELSGIAKLCNEVADNIQFVSNLTVGEQLEYGLF